MNIAVSIVIPMYNCAQFLDNLFSSLAPENTPEFEYIFINDGSTDNTYELCCEYAYNKNNVKVINNSNNGVSYSRNCGIYHSRGEYIMFVDADDTLVKNWESIVVSAIQADNKQDIIYFCKHLKNNTPKEELLKIIIGIDKQQGTGFLGAPWSKLYRKGFLINNKIEFDRCIIHGEDALFNIKSILLATKYSISNNSIYRYRINNMSATHRFDSRFLLSNERYLVEIENLLKTQSDLPVDIISTWVDYSFINSLYTFAGKLSKISPTRLRLEVIRDFYSRDYYVKYTDNVKLPDFIPMQKKIIFYVVRFRLLAIFEIVLPLIRNNSKEFCEEWLDV